MTTTTEARQRLSTRLSTYSMAPTLAPSQAPSRLSQHSTESSTPSEKTTTSTHNPLVQDMRSLQTGLARLDDPNMQRQRYEASDDKRDEISKLALGAKLDKALSRRMTSQDASFTRDASGNKITITDASNTPVATPRMAASIPEDMIGIAR